MARLRGAFALLFVLALPGGAAAQGTAAVVGRVSDSAGQPLASVLVFIDEGSAATLTDQLGLFGLFGLSQGPHRLGYRKAGYAPRSFALELAADDHRDLASVVLLPGPEPTATIGGTVTDGVGGAGLAGATVELNGRVVGVTDSIGVFVAPGSLVVWGSNDLTVRHRAFSERSVSDRLWVSNEGETFDLNIALDVEVVTLAEVPVTVESARLAAEGFYQRREDLGGSGTFMTREEISARSPRRMDDLLRGTSLGRTIRAQNRDPERMPPAGFGNAEEGKPCVPIFFLDGVRLELTAPVGVSSGLEQLITPDEVEGIEIYETISRLPARFSPIGATCGVILIWTR